MWGSTKYAYKHIVCIPFQLCTCTTHPELTSETGMMYLLLVVLKKGESIVYFLFSFFY